jgi:hypothetical protein
VPGVRCLDTLVVTGRMRFPSRRDGAAHQLFELVTPAFDSVFRMMLKGFSELF